MPFFRDTATTRVSHRCPVCFSVCCLGTKASAVCPSSTILPWPPPLPPSRVHFTNKFLVLSP
uniref:Uncharacterized protein n=1 Tax=Oryza brachyantha TaxID=4533 RepID=J3L1R5_ORYBR